jgi:hypothetical protein
MMKQHGKHSASGFVGVSRDLVGIGKPGTTELAERNDYRRTSIARWAHRNREALFVFIGAILWFLPGIWWGTPVNGGGMRMSTWGTDEVGPWGAVDAVLAIVGYPRNELSPQYPLGQFMVQALFVWPYYLAFLFPSVLGKLGLTELATSGATLLVLHRLPSVLMAAGTVVVVFIAARRTAGTVAGAVSAAAIATTGPLLYYARTSNVDAGALFWTALALMVALPAVREGFTTRRAIAIGLCAGIGTATKDQQYAFFLGLGIVLVASHFMDRRASGDWRGWWHAPVAGLVAAATLYLLASGIVVLPQWFAGHVRFITRVPDAPEHVVALAGFRYGTPATMAGYTELAGNAGAQLIAAIGVPIFALGIAGIAYTLVADRRLACLLLVPTLVLALGVIVPVRLVLPRVLLPVDLILCLFSGFAVAAAVRRRGAFRRAATIVAIAGIAWAGVRGADLTFQMLHDSRYEAGAWLERNVSPGDIVGYYGAPLKLPRLSTHAVVTPLPGQSEYAYARRVPLTLEPPTFIISIPQLITERVHEWTVPDETFAHLFDESSGYQQVLAIQTPALWPRPLLVAPSVNPPVRIFARRDIVPRLYYPVRVDLPDPH